MMRLGSSRDTGTCQHCGAHVTVGFRRTFAAVLRADTVVIPRGETVLEPGDEGIVIGRPESIHTFAHEIEPDTDGTPNILVVGGSDIGYHTARLLQKRGLEEASSEVPRGQAPWHSP